MQNQNNKSHRNSSGNRLTNQSRNAGQGRVSTSNRKYSAAPKRNHPQSSVRKKQVPKNPSILQMFKIFFSVLNRPIIQNKRRLITIFLIPAVLFYYEILLRIFNGTGIFRNFFGLLIYCLSGGLFFTGITLFFKAKVKRIINMVILYATALLFVVECLIFNSFQLYMTFATITNTAGDVAGGFGGNLIIAILAGIPVIILFFAPAILYTLFGKKFIPSWRVHPLFSIQVLVAFLILTLFGRIVVTVGGNNDTYKSGYDFTMATQTFGLMTGLRLDQTYAIFGNKSQSSFSIKNKNNLAETIEETSESDVTKPLGYHKMDIDFDSLINNSSDETIQNLSLYSSSLNPSKENKYTGLFEGKNLIMICAEAFSDAVVSKELTPTLYRLIHNGFYFSDYYQPAWGGSTSTGEFSMVMGIAPQNGTQTIHDVRNNNNYFTMGNQLQREGYTSFAYHDGKYDYYDRQLTHTNLGYDGYMGLGNGLEDIAGWWKYDSVMFDTTLDLYLDKQPFSLYYMTVTGHAGYSKSDDHRVVKNLDTVKAVLGDKYKATTLYYYCYQLELEYALQTVVEKLETAGIADDTVICLTSDHYPYGLAKSKTFKNSEDYIVDLYGGEYNYPWERDHNSLIIWSGCLENENKDMACEISTPTYSLDIVPTLSNLFGVEYDSRLLIGRDVFSTEEPLVLWNNCSFITTQGKYDAASKTFIPNDGVTVSDTYVDDTLEIVKNKLKFSRDVVNTDYYGVLFGPDND